MINISEKISDLRKAHNMTQEALGDAVGVSAQAVSKWEKGDSLPDISIIPDICKIFGISADALIGSNVNVTMEKQLEKLIDKALESDDFGTNKRAKLANKLLTGLTESKIETKCTQFSIYQADCFTAADSRGFGLYFTNMEYIKNMMTVDLTKSELLKFISDEKALKIFSLICINGMLCESEIIKLTGFAEQEIAQRIFEFLKYSVLRAVIDENAVIDEKNSGEMAYEVAYKGLLLSGVMASIFLFQPESGKGIMNSGEFINHIPERLRRFITEEEGADL